MSEVFHNAELVKKKLIQIKVLEIEIEGIQSSCLHEVVERKLVPDIYCGQGRSSTCLQCGKPLGCSTSHAAEVEERTWIEDKRGQHHDLPAGQIHHGR